MDGVWTATVHGTPAPKGSKRHVGNGVMIEMSKRVKPYLDSIVDTCRDAPRYDRGTPLEVSLVFAFQRPKGHFGTGRNSGVLRESKVMAKHTMRPDVDKLCRSVLDGLTMGGLIWDDSQVVRLCATKTWAPLDIGAYTKIMVGRLDTSMS